MTKGIFATAQDAMSAGDFDTAQRMTEETYMSLIVENAEQMDMDGLRFVLENGLKEREISIDFLYSAQKELATLSGERLPADIVDVSSKTIDEVIEKNKTHTVTSKEEKERREKNEQEKMSGYMDEIDKMDSPNKRRDRITELVSSGEIGKKQEIELIDHSKNKDKGVAHSNMRKPWSKPTPTMGRR